MANYTTNYNLTKPTASETASITPINGNMDIIDDIMHGSQVSLAPAYDNTQTYAVGEVVMYDYEMYKCITAVDIAEAFDSSKWVRTTASQEGGSGGGGSAYSETSLISTAITANGEVSLLDDINNYDCLTVIGKFSAEGGRRSFNIPVSVLTSFTYSASHTTATDHFFCMIWSTAYFRIARGSTDDKLWIYDMSGAIIESIIGVKY